MPRLIVNADDFGLTRGVNRAIAEAHFQGIVTSATLMANATAFDDAVKLAFQMPKLSVGCHVVLVEGVPLLPPSEVPTLVAANIGSGGRFHDSLSAFVSRALTGRLDSAQIESEAIAQIRKLQSSGLTVSHLDTHKHAHVFPLVNRALLRAARTCGVGAVRNPFSPRSSLGFRTLLEHPRLWRRHLQVRALRRFESGFLQAVAEAGLTTTHGCFGVVATGTLDPSLFDSILNSIPEGTWELVCHPGYSDADLATVKTRLRESRLKELHLLTGPATMAILERQGIELISYRDLPSAARIGPPT